MNPIERSAKLRQEADWVLQEIRLYDILRPCGRVVLTGSYFLNTMAYPDIDVSVPPLSIEQVFQIGGQLASCEKVFQVIFEKSRDPKLPGGLYIKPRIEYGDWGRPWKIDIWSLSHLIIDGQMKEMQYFKEKMTEPLREQIIRYKVSVLTQQKRTPMHSGYYIYKAFIDEGMTAFQEVTQYLIANGIRME
jgi:hypothetical protein